MADTNSTVQKVTFSFPFFSVLGIIFITLKLAGIGAVANWSWLWVLSPFWLPIVVGVLVVVAVLLVILVLAIITQIIDHFADKRRKNTITITKR